MFDKMAILQSRVRRFSINTIFYWIVVSSFYGSDVKCCESPVLLCKYPDAPKGCNALCDCSTSGMPSSLNCDGGLVEIPLGQFHHTINYVKFNNNNISVIKNDTFSGLSCYTLHLNGNNIYTIEPSAFTNMAVHLIDLSNNYITVIKKGTFDNIPQLESIHLSDNQITNIENQAFFSLPILKALIIEDGIIQHIEKNAFYNVTGNTLVLGISKDFSFKENFIGSHFNSIYFTQNPHSINCNCQMMWIALWFEDEQNRRSIVGNASCNDPENTPVRNLTMESFSKCREMPDRYECHEKEPVIMNCTLSFVSGKFVKWIHSRNGIHIRTLKTNILSISYCSPDDIGEYTCVRSTLYSAVPYINLTTTLYVKGASTSVNDSKTTLLFVTLGLVAAGLSMVVIIFVVVYFKRKQHKTQGSNFKSNDQSSNNDDTYDTIGMPSSTTEHYYTEITE